MPSIRRRERVRREDFLELTTGQERHLTAGYCWFNDCFHDRESFEEGWNLHGERLLVEWIANHPGSRPLGWWIAEHRQERPIISDHEREANERRFLSQNRNETFGFLHTSYWPLFQETERHYLERLGLLSELELTVLAERDAEQERKWAEDDASLKPTVQNAEYRKSQLFWRGYCRQSR